MDARFRIRTREGEEFTPQTLEIFSQMVRAGKVGPADLVFDALTGEWAPAGVHPIMRLFDDPLVTEEAGGDQGEGSDEPSLALDLVEPGGPSPEEEARTFREKMEEERRSDPDVPPLSLEVPLLAEGVGKGGVRDVVAAPASEAEPRPVADPTPAEPAREAVSMWMPTDGEVEFPRRRGAPRYRPQGWGSSLILGGAVVALVLSLLWPPSGVRQTAADGVAQAEEAPVAARPVPVTEEQTRAVAFTGFLDGMEALRSEMGVGEVPSIWLEGRYLADPGAYPEVRQYWARYLAFVGAARNAETTLYRGAYLTAAADAGLAGPVRSLRLASAQEGFRATRREREALYRKVEGLARAALALDDLLLEMKGRITYEPIAGSKVSADPVIEAAGTDPEAQARLEKALDRVLKALQGADPVSTGDRAGVPEWLVAGLREVGGGR